MKQAMAEDSKDQTRITTYSYIFEVMLLFEGGSLSRAEGAYNINCLTSCDNSKVVSHHHELTLRGGVT